MPVVKGTPWKDDSGGNLYIHGIDILAWTSTTLKPTTTFGDANPIGEPLTKKLSNFLEDKESLEFFNDCPYYNF